MNRLAAVDAKKKEITLLPLNLDPKAKVAVTAISPIAPGQLFVRQLSFPEGVQVSVESGPEGMAYDNTSKELHWSIPEDQPQGETLSIILHLESPDGEESYHIEKIAIP